jgi:hypothetical protein
MALPVENNRLEWSLRAYRFTARTGRKAPLSFSQGLASRVGGCHLLIAPTAQVAVIVGLGKDKRSARRCR